MQSKTRFVSLLAITLTVAFASNSTYALPQAADTSTQNQAKPRQWEVRAVAVAGSPLKLPKLRLSIDNAAIVVRKKDREVLSIPDASVVDLLYDDVAHNTAGEAWNSYDQRCPPGQCGDVVGAAYLEGLLFFTPVLAAFKTHHHLIHILWQSNGHTQTEVLEAGSSEYKSVMSALENATGKKCRDLTAERRKLAEELAQSAGKRIPLKIEREAVIGNSGLEPGNYEVTLLERGSGRGGLYFFTPEEKDPLKVVGSTPVTIDSELNNISSAVVSYAQQGGATTIPEIRFPGQHLHIPPVFLPPEAYKSVRSFYAGEQLWAHVSYETYRGEPAFRFPVWASGRRANGVFNDSGFVHLTRNDVSYVSTRAKNEAESFRFPLADSHLTFHGRGSGLSPAVASIQLSAGKKTVYFGPFYGANPMTVMPDTRERLQRSSTGFCVFFLDTARDFDTAKKEYLERTLPQNPASASPQL